MVAKCGKMKLDLQKLAGVCNFATKIAGILLLEELNQAIFDIIRKV